MSVYAIIFKHTWQITICPEKYSLEPCNKVVDKRLHLKNWAVEGLLTAPIMGQKKFGVLV